MLACAKIYNAYLRSRAGVASVKGDAMMKSICFECESINYSDAKTEKAPENLNTRHCHDKYEIIYVAEGSGRYVVEGVEYLIKPRTLMIFPPLVYHCVSVDADSVYERYVVHFDASAIVPSVADVFTRLVESAMPSGAYYTLNSISDAPVSVIERMRSIAGYPKEEREKLMQLLLSELILILSVEGREELADEDWDIGARVIRYLNENAFRDISLDKLAKRFFVSKYYLCRAFKKHNGISIHGYIVQKRVMHAKQLIESGVPAASAASRVGFGDYSAFYRAYMKVVGRAPTAHGRMEDEL